MSNEATPVNKTPLKVVTLDEVLEAERDKIVGNGNPDGYLLPYANQHSINICIAIKQ